MISKFFTYAFLCANIFCYSQSIDLKKVDYKRADSIAINFPKKKYKTATELVAPLTESFTTEHEKFRVLFRWITENIEYNKTAANVADADKVVRKNKAVCQGFSNLLKEMCNSANITCEVVVGYTKTDVKDINRKLKKTDHAWNIVTLNGQKYLVDVTWATSKYNMVTRKFQKDFDEHYFLTPPEKFILDHLPENKKDQLIEKPISKKKFSSTPLLYADYFHLGIESISPNKGELKLKKNKPFVFSFTTQSTTNISSAHILADTDKYITPIELKNNSFSFQFEKPGKHDLTIYLDGKAVAEYIITTK